MKYTYIIKKGDVFECLKDYVMDSEEVAYTKGKEYTSHKNGCITDNETDFNHDMQGLEDFFEHFKLVENIKEVPLPSPLRWSDLKANPSVVGETVSKGEIVNSLIVNAFRLDDEAFGWLMDKLNQRKVNSSVLEEILAEERSIISSPIRFDGVHVSHIKRIFEKYGIVNEPKF
jgi:hypothetical protein